MVTVVKTDELIRIAGHPGSTYEEFDRKSGEENLFDRRGQVDFVDGAQAVL